MSQAAASKLAPHVPARVFERLHALAKNDAELAAMLEDPVVLTDHKRVRDASINIPAESACRKRDGE